MPRDRGVDTTAEIQLYGGGNEISKVRLKWTVSVISSDPHPRMTMPGLQRYPLIDTIKYLCYSLLTRQSAIGIHDTMILYLT